MTDLAAAVAALTNATTLLVSTRLELLAWATGSASGGPKNDGTYPFTLADGQQIFVASPARITASNPNRILVPAFVTLWAGQSNQVGASVDRTHDYVTDERTLAYHQVNGLVPYRPNVFAGYSMGNPTGEWAGELRYAQRLRAAYPTTTHFVLKYAQGNTFLDDIPDQVDWNTASSGELFQNAAAHFAAAIAAIGEAGYDPIIRLVEWQQGENDTANAFIAGQYQANLTALVLGMRDMVSGWRVGSGVPIYIGRLSSTYVGASASRATVRAAQEAVVSAAPGGPAVLVDCDGLAMEADVTHFTKAGLYELGNRVADLDGLGSPAQNLPGAIANLAVGETTSTTVSLSFTNAARAGSYQYLLNGAGAWLPLPTSRQIGGLQPQTNYSVQLRAMNTSGTGPITAPIGFSTVVSGPQSLVKNGGFSTSADWLLRTGFSISGGKMHLVNVPQYEFSEQNGVAFIPGQQYELTVTVSNWQKGQLVFGPKDGAPIQIGFGGANETKSITFTAPDGATKLNILALGPDGTTMDLDDLVILPVE